MSALTGYEEVTLCGKKYMLKYNLNIVCDMEEYFQKGIAAVLTEDQVGLRLVRAFYYYGLKWQFHDITFEKVGSLLGKELRENPEANFASLLQPAMSALKKSRVLGGEPPKTEEEDVHLKTEEETEAADEEEAPQGESFPG